MAKSFKNLKVSLAGDSSSSSKSSTKDSTRNLYKYSVYMQSRDSTWLNRNLRDNHRAEPSEPIEEDIRD